MTQSIDHHEHATVMLEGTNGLPLILRTKFIIAALTKGDKSVTQVTCLRGNGTKVYNVKEHALAIPGAFNPDYFHSVTPNYDDGSISESHPWEITLHAHSSIVTYVTNSTPEDIRQAVAEARHHPKGPRP